MAHTEGIRVASKVKATAFRSHYRRVAAGAKGSRVVLIENRRQRSKYLVDKDFLDRLLAEHQSIRATLEVLANPELTRRLLALGKTVDGDVRRGRLRIYTTEEVFG